jgi:hypothetical protein
VFLLPCFVASFLGGCAADQATGSDAVLSGTELPAQQNPSEVARVEDVTAPALAAKVAPGRRWIQRDSPVQASSPDVKGIQNLAQQLAKGRTPGGALDGQIPNAGPQSASKGQTPDGPAGEPARSEGDDGLDTDAATGFYRVSWCGVQPLIETEAISRDEALANCQLIALYNPQIDLYCTWNDEVLFDGCEEGDGSDEAAATGIYRGYFCDAQLFIETEGIPAADALANCELNAASNPELELYCTWNDEVIFDGCSTSDVAVPAPEAVPAPAACEGWEPVAFDRAEEFIDATYWSADEMNCDGASYRRFDARYGLWVGLVSCGSGYRFFLSETADGSYLPAADYGGHGQDLCELVDPSFSIPNEDDITSGGCTDCSIGTNYSFIAGEVFARGAFGQPFIRGEAPPWGPYQSSVIRCASGPVECGIAVE